MPEGFEGYLDLEALAEAKKKAKEKFERTTAFFRERARKVQKMVQESAEQLTKSAEKIQQDKDKKRKERLEDADKFVETVKTGLEESAEIARQKLHEYRLSKDSSEFLDELHSDLLALAQVL
jgi:hypothetical protein